MNYAHDVTWFTIYGSQIRCLEELNRRPLKLEEMRAFYDAAALQDQKVYKKYSFDQWLFYMRSQGLAYQEGAIFQITPKGHDFLKANIRNHRSAQDKVL
jgi:glutamine cyclotransferase